MLNRTRISIAMLCVPASGGTLTAGEGQAEGFVEGSSLSILNRNFYVVFPSTPAALVERLSLDAEARRVANLFALAADEKRIALQIEGNGEVMGNRLMVQRAISNLLSNAIRHGPGFPPAVPESTNGALRRRSLQQDRRYSTVTDLARLRGWSTSVPLSTAT
ncbi:putative sensor-like histidine kinase YedV [compost metagenome]